MNNKLVKSIRTLGSFSFYQQIDYFSNSINGSTILYQNKKVEVKERSIYVLNYILKSFCYSYKSYNETAYKVLKTKYNNPIFINDKLIFISTKNIKDYNNIWINYSNVKTFKVDNEFIILYFYSGNSLKIIQKVDFLHKQINKIETMKTYLFNVRFYI